MRIKTRNIYPPIPLRNFDRCAYDDETYCCPECRSPVGDGRTEQEAIDDLLSILEEK